MVRPFDVFISHAEPDASLLQELEEHLSSLTREGLIRPWSKGQLAGGDARKEQIEQHLRAAPVVLLLVSASYFASDELHNNEMIPALARARAGNVQVFPILVRPFDRAAQALSGLSVLPPNGKPVTSWPDHDAAWASIVGALRTILRGTSEPAGTLAGAPEPAYESDEIRALSESLAQARARRAALACAGASTVASDREILDLRRRLREGGRLRAGDALGEGRYLLLRQLGRGGFGSVWAALDGERRAQVAIKVLHADQARDRSRRERFFRGARIMASLSHPAVVKVLAPQGEDGGYLYFVMELVDGEDLHRAVESKRFPSHASVSLILRVGDALGLAHVQDIVHRDVKPANILLDRAGNPHLTDFDLVAANDTTGGTRTGALGTFLFTSPEQMTNAKEADARSDVYALGMTAIFCLHGGSLPQHTMRRPDLVIQALPCDDGVKRVLTRAIELAPNDRFENALAFCQALREATRPTAPVPARLPETETATQEAPRGRSRARFAAGVVSACGLVAAMIVLLMLPPKPAGVMAHFASHVREIVGSKGPKQAITPAGMVPTASGPTSPASVALPPPPQPRCPDGMVLIHEGTFTMGSNDGADDEKPPHQVKISAFCLDKLEVTVAAYRQCTEEKRNAVHCKPAETTIQWTGASPETQKFWSKFCNANRAGKDLHPINCVEWTQAADYCKWAGGSLPSEAQWEYAARGMDGREYPWGNARPGKELLNSCGRECSNMIARLGKNRKQMYEDDDKDDETAKGGEYPDGKSPFGVLDMSGNVWEWVADWYAPYPARPAEGETIPEAPQKQEKNPESNPLRAIRGGAWTSTDASLVRAANRHGLIETERLHNLGFRCSRAPQR
ncbi:Protein kinase [Sorangium cellulosum So ce56]|uniref:Protein kinase n=1 Tax=Sorangium cellulosum (strain So ce56) TaxID=448385 RepID=A9EU91_SORC5|nr:SUMF1/EgtB/PvdO family nonheme iron enzyme [Sorangium cellulosum]CAN91078.1 Protein kinase [Sorangium cellulosum So ce56]